MATIQPFRGIRYQTTAAQNDVSTKIAPPYDVLDLADKQALLKRDAANFVGIDLPYVPAKSAGAPAGYQAAAEQLQRWLADGTCVRDERPSLYVYYQRYRHDGVEYTRRKFFARLRLEPFGSGSVYPHEQTFGGPKEDRLCLTQTTRCNLSPIFGLYPDGKNTVAEKLSTVTRQSPTAVGTIDGVEGKLWRVDDGTTIQAVTQLLADKPIYIADGHHRYGTSLLYRDWLEKSEGNLSPNHPAQFVLCVLCALEDPGLLILPTHRVLVGQPVSEAVLRADAALDVTPLNASTPAAVPAALQSYGAQAVALFDAARNSFFAVRPRDPEILRPFEPKHSDAWRKLGLAFLHAYLLDRLVTPKLRGGTQPEIHYVKAADAACEEARATGGSAFLLQPTTMSEMSSVCQAGDLMPQKSTFFFPKLASGMVVNPLYE